MYCKQSKQKIGIFCRSAVLINRLNRNIFLCFYVFGHSLGWSEKTFCLEDLGILHSAWMNICIFEPFRAYSKVGVDHKILVDMSCFWRTKIVCFTSFKDQFNPRKWKKSLKVQNFEVVNSAICAIFTLCHCKNLAAECWSDFPPEKFYFEIFSKTNAVSITFGLRYIHGQSLKEIDFPTRNAVDRFEGDSLIHDYDRLCSNLFP